MKILAAALCICWIAINSAYAHSPLASSVPTNAEQLAQAPETIVLNFKKKARVTKVTLVRKVPEKDKAVRLDLPSKKFVRAMKLTSPLTGPGEYAVNWRALSLDGHAVSGSFQFTVTGN